MNVKRFIARNSRDALTLVRQALGSDAVVLSTHPCAEGVEVLAMAPGVVQHFERVATPGNAAATAVPTSKSSGTAAQAAAPAVETSTVAQDAESLAMSTLSFQDYVRERMLRRRKAEVAPPGAGRAEPVAVRAEQPVLQDEAALERLAPTRTPQPALTALSAQPLQPTAPPPLGGGHFGAAELAAARNQQQEMLSELRSMKDLIEDRFGALAFMEKLQRQPRQALLSQKMLDCGFSPALTRKLVDGLPSDVEEVAWATGVLERNLATGEHGPALEEAGGVYALIGATGVGKTTSTAKLAAAFATRHGAANLGLITLDAYRVAAHEQLRAYGRILGVPVHTAHDRASLEDLLELLAGKRMVLIDTAGMAQRDSRTRELLEMLSQPAIQKLLVVNASAQGETIEDQIVAYRAAQCRGVVLSKVDEAVKVGPALDAMIRHKLEVVAVANGQRVPEDWYRLSAATLVQRAWRGGGSTAWRLDGGDVSLVFAGAGVHAMAAGRAGPVDHGAGAI